MDYSQSILEEFATESLEHLEHVENDILLLFKGEASADCERIDRIFRSIHSIKGAAGFLQLEQIADLSHALENLLDGLRLEKVKAAPSVVNVLLEGSDLLRIMLSNVEHSDEADISQVCEHLNALLNDSETGEIFENRIPILHQQPEQAPAEAFAASASAPQAEHMETEEKFVIRQSVLENLSLAEDFLYVLRYDFEQLRKTAGKSPVTVIRELLAAGEILDAEIRTGPGNLPEALPEEPLLCFAVYASFLDAEELCDVLDLSESAVVPLNLEKIMNPSADPADLFPKDVKWISFERSSLSGQNQPVSAPSVPGTLETETLGSKPETPEKLPESSKPEKKSSAGHSRVFYNKKFTDPEKKALAESEGFMGGRQHDIRIDLEKLDLLVNLVGELVIAESMITARCNHSDSDSQESGSSSRNLRRIISELQDVAMSMRMIPLTQTFRKMSRLVHDLSGKLGKSCRLEIAGEETELDKSVIEQITDPLLHIIRNCLDHGIESSEERKAAGKSESGTIRMEARHRGGEVLIRISDDGRGLDREKILAKSAQRGILPEERMRLDRQSIDRLIFEPGFSTVDRVTDVSGRGVGLDVVKKNIEKLKGRVDVRSAMNEGTVFILRIPLTLAIIDGMLIRVGSSCYTIPLLSIRESFRPAADQIIATVDGQEIIKIREELIPVIRLHEIYKMVPDHSELEKGILIHVASGRENICLFADEIIGHHQTVIKRMPNYVASARGISGCTILSSGEVSLILDVGDLIEMSGE
ncbi:MAG: chemotaxis protein CheA [Desulfobacterales bacterium]